MVPLSRENVCGGPDGHRIREFHTSDVVSITQPALPFPAYFPLVDAYPANPSCPTGRHHRLDPAVWPEVRRRAHQESLRQLAAAYGVSHETIRRTIRTEGVSLELVPSRGPRVERLSSPGAG
jgi:hypothetical protein